MTWNRWEGRCWRNLKHIPDTHIVTLYFFIFFSPPLAWFSDIPVSLTLSLALSVHQGGSKSERTGTVQDWGYYYPRTQDAMVPRWKINYIFKIHRCKELKKKQCLAPMRLTSHFWMWYFHVENKTKTLQSYSVRMCKIPQCSICHVSVSASIFRVLC